MTESVFILGIAFGLAIGLLVGVIATMVIMIYRNQAETKAAYYYGLLEAQDGTGEACAHTSTETGTHDPV